MDLWHTPSFAIYALFTVGLAVLLIAIDSIGGTFRARSKTTPNQEDASTIASGAKLVELDPDGVARVMRAHRNALANIVPFLILGFVYVALGASPLWVAIIFGVFTFARLAHAFAYISGKQPWRTLSFVVGQACIVALAVQIVRGAIGLV